MIVNLLKKCQVKESNVDSRYIAVLCDTIVHTAQQLQW